VFEEWNRYFSGESEDYGIDGKQTSDGGYIISGTTNSFSNGSVDVWLIKTDSEGQEEWNQTIGGSSSDEGTSVQQTIDGGYIITGITYSYGNGSSDVWLIKVGDYSGPTWHVATTGSDDGDGSEENPFATIQTAVNNASNSDTVFIKSGLYAENIYWSMANNVRLIDALFTAV
jgi:hypothetical protein